MNVGILKDHVNIKTNYDQKCTPNFNDKQATKWMKNSVWVHSKYGNRMHGCNHWNIMSK